MTELRCGVKPIVLLNDHASRFDQLEPLEDSLRAEFDLVRPGSKEATRRAAREAADEGAPAVVAAGGDGTIHDVLGGLAEAKRHTTLGVLPLGTGNDLARTLGIPLDVADAVEAMCAGLDTRELDLMELSSAQESRVGINVLNFGLASEVEAQMDEELKSKLGPFAYLIGGAKAATQSGWQVDLCVDDEPEERFEIAVLAVCNGRSAGGGFELGPTADPEDGLLDVLVVRQTTLPGLAVIAGKARAGALADDDAIERRTGRTIRIRVHDRRLGATLDGEPAIEDTDFSVRVLPGAQRVWVGPSYARSPLELKA